MGKRVFFQKQNHMDLLWRRCWDKSPKYRGSFIRSYAQVEEMILDSDMALMEREPGYVTSIEQTLTLRKYLERNPDKLPLIKKLTKSRNIELMCGGESIIDYNMVCGESIVRNFLYSLRWAQREFGVQNSTAIMADSFGMSGQLPQILRQLGFDYVTQIGRVFENKKDYWRGIDGTLICFGDPTKGMAETRAFISLESYTKYADCSVCRGQGCGHCHYTGLDTYSYRFSDKALVNLPQKPSEGMLDDPIRRALEYARTCPQQEVTIYLSSEEILQDGRLLDLIHEYREKHGMEIAFMTKEEEYLTGTQALRRRLNSSPESILPEEIDSRAEGNCVGTGCYVSRIGLKQTVREAEGQLLAAETLAALAYTQGRAFYPAKKIETLWRSMSLCQFHDALTASHIDEACDELVDHLQNVLLGSEKISMEAMAHICGMIGQEPPMPNGTAFVLFNVLGWDRAGIHRAVVQLDEDEYLPGGMQVLNDRGNPLDIVTITAHELTARSLDIFQKRYSVEVIFQGCSIPAMGYRMFTLAKKEHVEISAPASGLDALENGHYRIDLDEYGICSIFDKKLGRYIGERGLNELILEEDYGSPWETLARPYNWARLRKKGRVTGVTVTPVKQEAVIEGSYDEREDLFAGNPQQVNRLNWKQTITLIAGDPQILFRTEIDWDTSNRRVKIAFPLGFGPEGDKAFYEIPFGAIERERYEGSYGTHIMPGGDWPALNWVEAYNKEEDYSIALLNKGLPCHRVEHGTLYLSVLRSPQIPVYIFDYEGARDAGHHVFEYALTSHEHGLKESCSPRMGMEMNTPEKCLQMAHGGYAGNLPPAGSFLKLRAEGVAITAVKRAEEDEGLVIRINETNGVSKACALTFKFPVMRCFRTNLLEEAQEELAVTENAVAFTIKPFEIVTLKAVMPSLSPQQ